MRQQTTQSSKRVLIGIAMKITAVLLFVGMSSCLKATTDVPVGEMVFFRSFIGLVPIFAWYWWRGELKKAFYTKNIAGHFWRGLFGVLAMACAVYSLLLLPLPETIAIGYATPLIIVILCAIFLQEKVRIYRWSAVIIGLVGVMMILWPRLSIFSAGSVDIRLGVGALVAALGAFLAAIALFLMRRLVFTEKTSTIVIYFMFSSCFFALLTLPFGWIVPDIASAFLLVGAGFFGGLAQIFVTETYRYAEPSIVAPFEYVSMIVGLVIGYVVFHDVPTLFMLLGASVVIASGIFIIYRESRLGKMVKIETTS